MICILLTVKKISKSSVVQDAGESLGSLINCTCAVFCLYRSRETDRERERERERERSLSRHSSPHEVRRNSVDERSRDIETRRDSDHLRRSRSRSPVVRNGPISVTDERHKNESALHNNIDRSHSHDSTKESGIKEERRDIMIIEEKRATLPRPEELRNHVIKEPHNDLLRTYPGGIPAPASMALSLERARLMNPYLSLERPPNPTSLWNPLEKSAIDQHRIELQREMERERDRILHRFPNPLGSMIDHERYREQQEMMLRERAIRDRETLERMAAIDRERAAMIADIERSGKMIPPLRPVDPFLSGVPPSSLYAPRPGAGSPVVNHSSNHGSKTNSPSSSVGAPPPLIPSGSIRAHTASPITTKPKVPGSPMSNLNHSDSAPPPPIKDKPLDGTTNGIDTNHSQSR